MRAVSSHIDLNINTPALLVLAIAPHSAYTLASERLGILLDGKPVEVTEELDTFGARRHRVEVGPGALSIAYDATVEAYTFPDRVPGEELEYLRPSRYCDSDRLAGVAQAMFGQDGSPAETVDTSDSGCWRTSGTPRAAPTSSTVPRTSSCRGWASAATPPTSWSLSAGPSGFRPG